MKRIVPAISILLAGIGFCEPSKFQEFTVRMLCNDRGKLYVNGMLVLNVEQRYAMLQATLYLRPGDVVSAAVFDPVGGEDGLLILVASLNNSEAFTISDFKCAVEVDPDWRISDSFFRFASPSLKPSPSKEFNGVKNLKKAWSQPGDQDHRTVFFKYVVP